MEDGITDSSKPDSSEELPLSSQPTLPVVENREADIPKSSENRETEVEDYGTETTAKITKLDDLASSIRNAFEEERDALQRKINLWGVITIGLIITLFCIYIYILFPLKFDAKWTWQVGYETAIRITFVSLFVSIIAFCIKMLRSYFHLYENNRHKIAVIKSMPTLVLAAEDDEIKRLAYTNILEMLIKVDDTGILNKENELITGNLLIELVKQSLTKKEGK